MSQEEETPKAQGRMNKRVDELKRLSEERGYSAT